MDWLKKGERVHLAVQGPSLGCGWSTQAREHCVHWFLPPPDSQQHSRLISTQPKEWNISAKSGQGVWHGHGRLCRNRAWLRSPCILPAHTLNTEFPCLLTLANSNFYPKVKPKRMSNCGSPPSGVPPANQGRGQAASHHPSQTQCWGAVGPTVPHDNGTKGSAPGFTHLSTLPLPSS